MTNLSDFLKVKKVRCVSIGGYSSITAGKEYDVVGVDRDSVFIVNDDERECFYSYKHFEPVLDSAENPLQEMKLTPEFKTEASEPKFKVGDKVYCLLLEPKIFTILKVDGDNDNDVQFAGEFGWASGYSCCHANQENYERLQAIFPRIEFEPPPKELAGSDLCRAMLEKGWKYVPCYVHDGSDDEAINRKHYVSVKNETPRSGYNFSGTGANDWKYAVPIDPRTGEPLTQAMLDE